MHMIFIRLSKLKMLIHLTRKVQIALLIAKEIKIPNNYSDFFDVFLEERVLMLPKITKLNQHAIELQKGQ